ncbi:MAG: ECF-type riboflavin transporter substrate-binding protein [Solobacterium sp.]|nr:ECF-type riboflavin transporter substrate-binding protein [Erysipelotrichaceae bacterium]MCI6701076.1 ECF-type riboflavin transporter substrate-binding protein [Solobacterium sp.]MCI7732269.1 ECF-type riboflavin transporter substrate-binding protein [Solobacterium sp.]MDD5842513.1 ECF-type riboflavin transporter substrate-binding protein [Solobacterium sp.]MDD5983312.1 ECF-type riboflavin transporter substrate-binding protein [Solobacterium sp.]
MTTKKQSLGSILLGKWNTKTIVGIAIGAALFGVLMNFGSIRVTTNTSLTTSYIVLPIVGALFGPLPAFLTGLIGNTIADLIGGWGLWFDWSFGNAVAGFFMGLLPLYGAKIEDGVFTVKHAIIYAVVTVVGVGIGFGLVTPVLTYLFYSSELTVTWIQAWAAIVSDASVAIIVGVPVLFALAKRNARGTNLSKE